jgi:hypothetical protein
VQFCLRGCGSEHPQLYLQNSYSLTHRLNKVRCWLLLLSSTISISPLVPVSGPAHVTSSLYQINPILSVANANAQRPTPNDAGHFAPVASQPTPRSPCQPVPPSLAKPMV